MLRKPLTLFRWPFLAMFYHGERYPNFIRSFRVAAAREFRIKPRALRLAHAQQGSNVRGFVYRVFLKKRECFDRRAFCDGQANDDAILWQRRARRRSARPRICARNRGRRGQYLSVALTGHQCAHGRPRDHRCKPNATRAMADREVRKRPFVQSGRRERPICHR